MKKSLLTVVCVKVGSKYTAEYVIRLRNMVARNLKEQHKFVCFTDDPDGLADVDWYRLPDKSLKGWWAKINLFRADLPFSGPMLYLDLDVIVTGSIDEMLLEVPPDADFAIIRQWKNCIKRLTKYGHTNPIYNSSMMYWRSIGCRSHIAETLTLHDIDYWRGDQDWIAECCPKEFVFPDSFFCCYEDVKSGPEKRPGTKLVLFSKLENHYIAPTVRWVRELWR